MPASNHSQLPLRPGVVADCTGALWLAASSALLIADAHLGYAWAQRRRGELGPLTDGGIVARLRSVLDRWKPARVVFLGDVVHLGTPSAEEQSLIEETLTEVIAHTEVFVVLGNHDRRFEEDFGHLGLRTGESWEDDGVLAVHGDKEWPSTAKLLVVGHLHPAVSLEDAVGARQKLPVFAMGERALVLPAFSPFAAGFDVRKPLPAEWQQLFGEEEVELAAITGTQVRRIPLGLSLRYRPPGEPARG